MFIDVEKKLQAQFATILATGTLFKVEVDRDKIWELYLGAFPDDLRQSNNCNCCKSFLRQYGGIVGVGADLKTISLWDFDPKDEEYNASIKALSEYVHSLPITGIFLNEFPKCGTLKNLDQKRNLVWNHLYLELPTTYVKPNVGPLTGTALDNKSVLKRSLEEITDSAVETTLELIGQNSLYRGQEFKGMLTEFQKLKEEYKKTKAKLKDNFCWLKSSKVSGAVARIRNSSIGTLLNDLSEGVDLDKAVTSFEKVVAPSNYKRPTALVTPRMIEDARKRLEELNLLGSLERRVLNDADLTVNNTLFVHRASGSATGNIFDDLKKEVIINPKTLSKVEEISITDFVEKVLPTAKSVKVLVENSHLGNFATLVGPKSEHDEKLFKWGNNVSWSYVGAVTDSIKERVKQAGGNVGGVMRISLSWHNFDDLDLHLHEPSGYKVYYGNKCITSPSGAVLDVDMNMGMGHTRIPVENISWVNPPKEGKYKIVVNQFSRRESTDTGFEVEMEYNGDVYTFGAKDNGPTGRNYTIADFTFSHKNGLVIDGKVDPSKYCSKEQWGVKTGVFHRVKSICLSPNHWDNAIGNKHYFFFLEGCKSPDLPRPFYNEFLKEELSKDRKVFEVLGSKIKVDPAESELSGLGFSDTNRASIFVEVEGNFKRTLKVKF